MLPSLLHGPAERLESDGKKAFEVVDICLKSSAGEHMSDILRSTRTGEMWIHKQGLFPVIDDSH